jgi:hypothetical protein
VVGGFGYRRFDYLGLTPRYAFGYGLSYTTFEIGNLIITSTATLEEMPVLVSVDVTNTGPVTGDEVVQLYLSTEFTDPRTREVVPMPAKQLRGFRRVTLEPGESVAVTVSLGLDELAFWSVSDDSFRVEAGTYIVRVGGASDHLPLSNSFRLTSSALYNSATHVALPTSLPVLGNVALGRPVTYPILCYPQAANTDRHCVCPYHGLSLPSFPRPQMWVDSRRCRLGRVYISRLCYNSNFRLCAMVLSLC